MKHVRTFHSLSSLLLKQQSNVYNKPLCEKRSEMLRFSRLPQEAATELHRSQWSLECDGSPYHLDPLCRTPTNKYSYTRGTLSTRGSCVSLVVSAR